MAFSYHVTYIRTKGYCHQILQVDKDAKAKFSNCSFMEPQEVFQITPNYFLVLLHSSSLDFPVASYYSHYTFS